jgi:hypothetical protein
MLTGDEPYSVLCPEWLARRTDEAHASRLVAQLSASGIRCDPRPGRLTGVAEEAEGRRAAAPR